LTPDGGGVTIERRRDESEAPMFCPSCGSEQPDDHRFCLFCGARMPLELLRPRGPKQTDLFLGIPTHPADPPEPVLRVSRYLDDIEVESVEGSVVIPGHHVRFSIWIVDRPVCAMSLTDDEAERLGRFLLGSVHTEPASRSATSG
jgi:zinc ribbon protein